MGGAGLCPCWREHPGHCVGSVKRSLVKSVCEICLSCRHQASVVVKRLRCPSTSKQEVVGSNPARVACEVFSQTLGKHWVCGAIHTSVSGKIKLIVYHLMQEFYQPIKGVMSPPPPHTLVIAVCVYLPYFCCAPPFLGSVPLPLFGHMCPFPRH